VRLFPHTVRRPSGSRAAAGTPTVQGWISAGLATLALTGAFGAGARAWAIPVVPAKFVVESASPGVTFDVPTCIAFLPDGRLLVGEKRGRIWIVTNGIKHGTALWSREDEVETYGDCGLMSIAVDPAYAINRRLYFLYTADADSNGVDVGPHAFGRLARYEMSAVDSNALVPTSRTILMGTNWTSGPLVGASSHTVGSLRFGSDGSLLVSIGEGGDSGPVDAGGLYPTAFGVGKTSTSEDIGAFRAQYTSSLCGKILRINPATGTGYSSNPFYQSSSPGSAKSRVWAYGLRNPFRMTVRPGTGSTNPSAGQPGAIFAGDVGWLTWEEIDLTTSGGKNFGWPCYEGLYERPDYVSANPSHHDCRTIGHGDNPSEASPPLIAWHHSDTSLATPPGNGLLGNCAMAGTFYTGTRYPVNYAGRMFFLDFGLNWMKVATFDANNQITDISEFATNLDGPVDFTTNPLTGDIYYAAIATGEVRRIRYTGPTGSAPIPEATAGPMVGAAPLAVSFSSEGSNSPIGRPLTFFWNFGDESGSSSANPSHSYGEPGEYDAVLTASDDLGGESQDTVRVIVTDGGSFPTTAVLDDFERPDGPIGGQWVDDTTGLLVDGGQLTQTFGVATPVFNVPPFGPNQEAYVTLAAISPTSPHHTLMLKVQGTSFAGGHIQVRYDPSIPRLSIATYAPSESWITRGELNPVTFVPGDRLGARALSNGLVEVYRNSTLLGTFSVGWWPFAGAGGRVGFALQDGANARFDDFGGGDALMGFNEPPIALIAAPLDSTFFVAADTVRLTGSGSDSDDPMSELTFHWQIDTHHNNHVHPGTFVSDQQNTYFVASSHDDGTGSHLRAHLTVTDTEDMQGSAFVDIFPEVDLTPSAVTVLPAMPPTESPAEYRFWLRNFGRMSAPFSRWVLQANGTDIAEGDVIVPARDSVLIVSQVPPELGPGTYTLRVMVDSLARVVETNESNNAQVRPITVVAGSGPDVLPPMFTVPPAADPYGVTADVDWSTNEPATGVVRYGLTTALGDSVVGNGYTTTRQILLSGLQPVRQYYYVVVARDTLGNVRTSSMLTFNTEAGPLAAESDLPRRIALSSPYPNPARNLASFVAELPAPARVQLQIFDLQGRTIWSDGARQLEAGRWTLGWSAQTTLGLPAAPGLYLARVQIGAELFTRRVVVVR